MQHYLFIVLAMPLVASGSGMFSVDDLVQAHAEAFHVHADHLLKAEIDAAHERFKLQLVQVEEAHAEHVAAHEDAKAMLEKLDSQHGLADLKYFLDEDRLALQATNCADRDEVRKELARLVAEQATTGSSADTQMLIQAQEHELASLEARQAVFESFAAQAKAAAAKAHSCTSAQEHLTKLGELSKKAAAAPKAMRGATAKHIFHLAMAEGLIDTDVNAGHVNLVQTRAVVLGGGVSHCQPGNTCAVAPLTRVRSLEDALEDFVDV
jgi:hypothetical protein